jgi:HK97 gp10 family phage protein
MSLIQAYARAQFRPPGEFLIGFRSKLAAIATRAQDIAYEEARALVPVDTGELRDSIQKDPIVDDGELVIATVSATANHSAYIEFGTGKRGAESPGADLRHRYTLSWPGMVAQPYLRPALDSARGKVLEEFQR